MTDTYHQLPVQWAKEAIKAAQDRPTPRPHLGASQIGNECRADLWHGWRWNVKAEFDAETHLRFLDGHRSEDVMADYLRKAGVKLSTGTANGDQHRVSMFGGHFAGSLDGIILGGVPWHHDKDERSVWEHKAVNEKKFKKLIELDQKKGLDALVEWDEVYYAQGQIYMLLKGINTHWLTCSTPGCRDFTAVMTKLNRDYAQAMLAKAENIITSFNIPPRAFAKPDFYKAKFLNSYDILYRDKIPAPNHRNSIFANPLHSEDRKDGAWRDDYTKRIVPVSEQDIAPLHHLYIPDLIPFADCVEIDGQNDNPMWVKYVMDDGTEFYNCHEGMQGNMAFSSRELAHLTAEQIRDPNVNDIRMKLSGVVTG
ncbi:hypothetical protein [Photobacterium halotolerans]|uniref:hypothetical protein n=1 Tax=Photobacterium halotolerans TaxID=265726 RepID=UPI0004069038|nr:hypothetical protein [Photobacterium halotolerans]